MDYSYIIIPLIVVVTAQALKLATDSIKGNFDLKNIFITYGGMPSAHTAFAVSVTTLAGLKEGFNSAIFGAALVFTLIIMRDATTFRRLLGKQAEIINHLINKLPPVEKKIVPLLSERMGHGLLEVIAGAGWGIALTYFLYLLT